MEIIKGDPMNSTKLSTLLNPVRMQLLKLLMIRSTATPKALSDALPDIPTTSLYRHLKVMEEEQIIEVASEKKIRGTFEKTYRIKENPLQDLTKDGNEISKADLLTLFYSFSLAQMMDMSEYLGEDGYPIEPGHLSFKSYLLALDDAEVHAFAKDLRGLVDKYRHLSDQRHSRNHKFAFSLIPERKAD